MEDGKKRKGRPPRAEGGKFKDAVLTDNFRFVLTPEMKAWLHSRGGAEYVRRLIAADMQRFANDSPTTADHDKGRV